MTFSMRAIHDYFVADTAVVTGDVVLGAEVNLWFSVIIRGDIARITLGPRVNLQDGVMVHTDVDAPQDIEAGVVAGHGAILHGRRIGKDTLIGIGATVLSGCEIGAECIVAAGSLVPQGKSIPPRSLVMGVPGKVVRSVSDEEVERTRSISARYLELARRYVQGEFSPPWNSMR